jgi:hypothetical protein
MDNCQQALVLKFIRLTRWEGLDSQSGHSYTPGSHIWWRCDSSFLRVVIFTSSLLPCIPQKPSTNGLCPWVLIVVGIMKSQGGTHRSKDPSSKLAAPTCEKVSLWNGTCSCSTHQGREDSASSGSSKGATGLLHHAEHWGIFCVSARENVLLKWKSPT